MKKCVPLVVATSFLLLGTGGANAAFLPESTIRPLVFVLAGQSNMAGRGLPVPAERPDPNVLTLTASGALVPAIDPLGDQGQGAAAGAGAGVGPGITFAKLIAAHLRRSVILLQCALGGSSAYQWLPGQPLFNECAARTAIAERYGQIAGLLDIQGETDAENAASASLWAIYFSDFVDGMRKEFGSIPFVYGQIGNVTTAIFPYRAEIQLEQAQLHIGNAVMVTTSDLPLGSDDIHFTTASACVVGERMARAWLSLTHSH